MSQNTIDAERIKPRKLLNFCCCCIPINKAVHVVGVLDLMAFFCSIIQCILEGISNGRSNLSFYTGSFLFTIIPSMLLTKLPRVICYLRMRYQVQNVRRRDIYYKIRLLTFLVQLIITSIDFTIFTLYLKGYVSISDNDNGDGNYDRTARSSLFNIIAGLVLIAIAFSVDIYYCLVVRQFRDDLVIEIKINQNAIAQTQAIGQDQFQPPEGVPGEMPNQFAYYNVPINSQQILPYQAYPGLQYGQPVLIAVPDVNQSQGPDINFKQENESHSVSDKHNLNEDIEKGKNHIIE